MNCPRYIVSVGLAFRMGRVVSVGLLLGAVGLSACGGPPQSGQAQADADTRAACRARADRTYNQQNRAEIYSPPATVNTPFSANYVPSMSDRGLSDRFVYDRMISDCVRNTGTESDRSQPSSPPPPR